MDSRTDGEHAFRQAGILEPETRPAAPKNNIGFLRLVFAALVIVGHAPEMIDGNRSREPLTSLFHTISFGTLSVDAFFLLSGYLIAQSMTRARGLGDYLRRRVLRIYPAFTVAWLLTVYLLGPIVGAHPLAKGVTPVLRIFVLTQPPDFPGALSGLADPYMNVPMWTILYEFRCYLLVAALGMAGLLARRRVVLGLTILSLLAFVTAAAFAGDQLERIGEIQVVRGAIGTPMDTLRLTSAFLVGACFYLYRDVVLPRLNWQVALIGSLATIALMYSPLFAEPALITLGAVVLFWLAFRAHLGSLQKINDKWDISYGMYLYGWPVANAIRWFDRGISPAALAALSVAGAGLCGAVSWWGLERRAKEWGKSRV